MTPPTFGETITQPGRVRPWVTVQEAADELCVSKMTIYRLINDGEIPAFRFGRNIRIPVKPFNAYVTRQRIRPGTLDYTRDTR